MSVSAVRFGIEINSVPRRAWCPAGQGCAFTEPSPR